MSQKERRLKRAAREGDGAYVIGRPLPGKGLVGVVLCTDVRGGVPCIPCFPSEAKARAFCAGPRVDGGCVVSYMSRPEFLEWLGTYHGKGVRHVVMDPAPEGGEALAVPILTFLIEAENDPTLSLCPGEGD